MPRRARMSISPRRFLDDTSGHFALLTAFTAPVALVLAAIAVDTGSLYVEKRRAQSLADLAAIAAAATAADPVKAELAALTVLSDNGSPAVAVRPGAPAVQGGDRLTTVTGRYDGDATLSPQARFTPGGAAANAAKVTYRTTGKLYFGASLMAPPDIVVTGLAAASSQAAFSVGSRLAALEGGVVNALLGGLTGSNISLSVMDYNALLSADVSLLSFLDALATELNLTAGSYTEVLDAQVTVGRVAKAVSQTPGLGSAAKAAAGRLASQAGGPQAPKLKLSQLIGIGEVGHATIEQIAADINVMELLSLGAIVAGKGRQVALDLGASVPGLLSVSVDLAIGEPPQASPWFRIGSGGELVRTAQTRLAVTVEIGNAAGLVGLLGARIRIPLYLELAYAEARLKDIACPAGRPGDVKVTVEARPGIANLYLAEVDRTKLGGFNNKMARAPARLIDVLAVSVTGQANVEMSNTAYKALTFSAADISARKVKQVSTQDFIASPVQSLFSSLALDVKVKLGGILNLPLVSLPANTTAALGQTIGAAAPALDGLLGSLLSTLGLSLGQADVRVHGASCGRAVLVQ